MLSVNENDDIFDDKVFLLQRCYCLDDAAAASDEVFDDKAALSL